MLLVEHQLQALDASGPIQDGTDVNPLLSTPNFTFDVTLTP